MKHGSMMNSGLQKGLVDFVIFQWQKSIADF